MSWLERIFRSRHLREELAEELQEHIEEKTEQLIRLEHLSRAEARQAALRAFGNVTGSVEFRSGAARSGSGRGGCQLSAGRSRYHGQSDRTAESGVMVAESERDPSSHSA
jgi:hypothetical protein